MDNYDIIFNILLYADFKVITSLTKISKLVNKVLISKTFWIEKFHCEHILLELDDKNNYLEQYQSYQQCLIEVNKIIIIAKLERKVMQIILNDREGVGHEYPIIPQDMMKKLIEMSSGMICLSSMKFEYRNENNYQFILIANQNNELIIVEAISFTKMVDMLTLISYYGIGRITDDRNIPFLFYDENFVTGSDYYNRTKFKRFGMLQMLNYLEKK